ncbi:hypothetical protein GGI05_002050 [Coemansia sp. RSA 2603]|nr:hypothetical protein GGI05_002050 [Coemansia sp. RSA 2603]
MTVRRVYHINTCIRSRPSGPTLLLSALTAQCSPAAPRGRASSMSISCLSPCMIISQMAAQANGEWKTTVTSNHSGRKLRATKNTRWKLKTRSRHMLPSVPRACTRGPTDRPEMYFAVTDAIMATWAQ